MIERPCENNQLLSCAGFEKGSIPCWFCPREWIKAGIKPKGFSKERVEDIKKGGKL